MKFNFYKFYWIKKRKKITTSNITFPSEKKLKLFIKRKKPDGCYISLNSFIDYQEKKPTRIIEKNFVIDLDYVLPKDVIKAVNLMRKKGYKEEYILQSSRHNFQIFYRKFKGDIKKTSEYLVKNGLQDSFVKNDDQMVIRLPESKHHTGFVSRYVTLKDLKNMKGITLPKKKSVKKDIYFYYKAVISKVYGVKDRHILIIKNPNIGRVKNLQKIYKLGHLYKIHFKRDVYVVSLKTFSLVRLKKIFKAYGKEFNKYNFLRVSQKVMLPDGLRKPLNYKGKLKVMESGIRKVEVIEGDNVGQFSKPIFNLLKDYVEIPKLDLVGDKIKYFEMELRGRK